MNINIFNAKRQKIAEAFLIPEKNRYEIRRLSHRKDWVNIGADYSKRSVDLIRSWARHHPSLPTWENWKKAISLVHRDERMCKDVDRMLGLNRRSQ